MQGILFDKDGTLLDFHASWSGVFRELCDDLADGDPQRSAALQRAGGMDPTGIVRAGSAFAAGNARDIVRTLFPALDGPALKALVARVDAVFFENGLRCSVPVPGLRETLAELAGTGIHMGVATSDGTAGTRAALTALGLGSYLPHVFGYDAVERPKPAPDMVLAFAAAIGAPPSRIVVVGDNTHDLEMARGAGACAVGVLSGTGAAADLAPLADAILGSVAELPEWLRNRAPQG